MPTQVVDVDLRSETGAVARRTYSDLVLIGREPDIQDPDYNVAKSYDSAATVATDYGENSDVYAASQEVQARGADHWWVLMLESTEVTDETVSATDPDGELENSPIRGGTDNVEITVDGTVGEIVPVTESPPTQPDAGKVAVNFDTGEVYAGDSPSGAGVEATYEHLDWTSADTALQDAGIELAVLADTRADRSYIGELDELVALCETHDMSAIVAYANGNEYESDQDAMEAAHDTGAYVPTGNLLTFAHKTDDDAAAAIGGRLSTEEPWFDPYMDGSADYTFSMDQYRSSMIGRPEQPGTFEGGNTDGEGPTNVLHTEQGVQILSNSLSTAGSSSNYQFFDVRRTELFVMRETRNALRSLRLRADAIPFAPVGRTLIENALRKTLNQYVASTGRALSQEEIRQLRRAAENDEESDQTTEELLAAIPEHRATDSQANVPLSELDIHVPRYDDLSQQDRANRVWTGIQITARLAGNAHTFAVELAVQV